MLFPTGIAFGDEASLRLFHFVNPDWVDATAPGSPDISNNIICGSVTSLSPFAILEPAIQIQPFAAFHARVEIEDERHERKFEVKATFILGANSNGIYPLTEEVSFQVGAFSWTIPAGSFTQEKKGRFKRDKKERFKFEGVINGVALEAVIRPLGGGRFEFKAEGEGADLRGTANPVQVSLTIGDDGGDMITVRAKFE